MDTRINALLGDREVGHITISHIPTQTWNENLEDPVGFCRLYCGLLDVTPQNVDRRFSPKRHQRCREFHVETMHVAGVKVEEEFQRRGIGTELYLRAARWAAENEGLLLASSDLQSPEAKGIWALFVSRSDIPTVKLPDGRWALNYRNSTKTISA